MCLLSHFREPFNSPCTFSVDTLAFMCVNGIGKLSHALAMQQSNGPDMQNPGWRQQADLLEAQSQVCELICSERLSDHS